MAAVCSLAASAQFSNPNKPAFGIKGGANFASVSISQEGSSASYGTGTLTNFSAGVFADLPLSERFSVQPGLFYSGKGYKVNLNFGFGSEMDFNAESSLKISYVQLPVNFLYNAELKFGKLFFGAGPFLAAAIKAKGKASGNIEVDIDGEVISDSDATSEDLEIGSNGDIKRLDYGATGLIGLKFNNGLLLSANYDYGLANIYAPGEGQKMKTRTIGVSVGFSF